MIFVKRVKHTKKFKNHCAKLYLSNLTDLSYQYIVPSKYCLLNILQLCSTDFIDISVVSSAITAKQEASSTSEKILDKISLPISVINLF